MLRTLLESTMSTFNISPPEAIFEKCAYLIADLLAGCWLNCGFRWQECFGMPLALKEEVTFQALFTQSARLIFEHVLLLKELPIPEKSITGFDVREINRFILAQKPKVLAYYQALVGVDANHVVVEPPKFYKVSDYFVEERSMFEVALIRLKDLLLLINKVRGPRWEDFEELDC